jgi:hypothetical protein
MSPQDSLADALHKTLLGHSGRLGPLPTEPTVAVRALSETVSDHVLTLLRAYATEQITLARLAELLGVNIADVQFLHPLCPPVYRREDL